MRRRGGEKTALARPWEKAAKMQILTSFCLYNFIYMCYAVGVRRRAENEPAVFSKTTFLFLPFYKKTERSAYGTEREP